MLDIAVFVSVNESFGVSVIEAMACEKPVIVSDVGGLPEVVDAGRVGMICPAGNPLATARAIERLIHSPQIAKKMAVDGRRHVKKLYNWPDNVKQMLAIYDSMVSK
jgi:glycosyltransferase involved in cell wall biosynthesis